MLEGILVAAFGVAVVVFGFTVEVSRDRERCQRHREDACGRHSWRAPWGAFGYECTACGKRVGG